MIHSSVNLVMTVIGFAVSTLFIVFVCTRLVCARIQLTASRRAFPSDGRSDLNLLQRGLHGLEPVLVSSFPTKKFSDGFFSSGEDSQCTVCLGEYQDKDVLRILPYCGHAFHVTCIDIWLLQHSTCPVCRVSLRDSPDRKRLLQPLFSPANRTSYSPDPTAGCSYNCLQGSPGYSARRMDSLRMNQFGKMLLCLNLMVAEKRSLLPLVVMVLIKDHLVMTKKVGDTWSFHPTRN